MLTKFLFFAFVVSFSFAEKFSFKGYHLLRVTPKNDFHLQHLQNWESSPDFDFWTSIKGLNRDIDILLSPQSFETYRVQFESIGLPYTIVDANIQEKIEKQELLMKMNRQTSIVGRYVRYADIMAYIDDVVSSNPSLASSYVAGQTYEKRNLKVIKIGTPSSQRKVWIDCGIHAREWVSPSTCVWIIDKLISEYKNNDNSTVDLLNYYEFHIMPLINADGYEYTHTTSRLWRKNRRPNSGSSCVGTDLNRNFGYQWLTGGSSSSPCSDIYAGPSANSELETKAVQKGINDHLGKWDAYLTIHSYGQWWFTTWGYTGAVLPPTYADQLEKANIGVKALQNVYGTRGWIVGSSAQILYVASGGSEDWAAGTANIKYANCIELRPGQSGTDSFYGFTLPEDRAPKVGEETWQGIKAFVEAIKKKF